MKKPTLLLTALTITLQATCALAAPPTGDFVASVAQPATHQASAYRGETLAVAAQLVGKDGRPFAVPAGANASMLWSTNGVDWFGPRPATVTTGGLIRATWTPDMDVGADSYRIFLRVDDGGASNINYRANMLLRMLGSPGATPNELPLPPKTIDFSTVAVSNAPWLTEESDPTFREWARTNAYVKAESDPTVPAWARAAQPPLPDLSGYATTGYVARAVADAEPGDYPAVSNAAMRAVQVETDPTVPSWAKAAQPPAETDPVFVAVSNRFIVAEADPSWTAERAGYATTGDLARAAADLSEAAAWRIDSARAEMAVRQDRVARLGRAIDANAFTNLTPAQRYNFRAVAPLGRDTVAFAVDDNSAWRISDNGVEPFPNPVAGLEYPVYVRAALSNGRDIVAIAREHGIYASSVTNISWRHSSATDAIDPTGIAYDPRGGVWWVSSYQGIWCSGDLDSWTLSAPGQWRGICYGRGVLVAGSATNEGARAGLWYARPDGSSAEWMRSNVSNFEFRAIACNGSEFVAGAYPVANPGVHGGWELGPGRANGIYRSLDGIEWELASDVARAYYDFSCGAGVWVGLIAQDGLTPAAVYSDTGGRTWHYIDGMTDYTLSGYYRDGRVLAGTQNPIGVVSFGITRRFRSDYLYSKPETDARISAAVAAIPAPVETDPVFVAVSNRFITAHQSLAPATNYTDTVAAGKLSTRGGTVNGNLTVNGRLSHGNGNSASGNISHAEGEGCTASGGGSHAEGASTKAQNFYSHSEGRNTTSSGDSSHSEGYYATASGKYSHAEGYYATSSGEAAHAEGRNTTASGKYTHADGYKAVASNDTAFVWQGSAIFGNAVPSYGSHGKGTFNVNPVGGADGFWVGETNLAQTISNLAPAESDPTVPAWAKAADPPDTPRTDVASQDVVKYASGVLTLSIAAGATVSATTNSPAWPDGGAVFARIRPAGAYSVAPGIQLLGYGTWPTNSAEAVFVRSGGDILCSVLREGR